MTKKSALKIIKKGIAENGIVSAERANEILVAMGYDAIYTVAVLDEEGQLLSGDASVSIREILDYIQLQSL